MNIENSKYNTKKFDCIGIGVCTVDYLSVLSRYPALNEKVESVANSVQGGGPVPNALAAASRLGLKCSYIGSVGNDTNGHFLINELQNFGVDTSFVNYHPNTATPFATIWIDEESGHRSVVLNRDQHISLMSDSLPEEIICSTPILLLDGRDSNVNLCAAQWVRDAGNLIVCDFGSVRQKTEELLKLTHYPVTSFKFVRQFLGDVSAEFAAVELLKYGCKATVVTDGKRGCWYTSDDGVFHQPAFQVDAIDTTGAGDAFHGAFVTGLKKNWDIRSIVQFASAVAAISCKHVGGKSGLPTIEETINFLEKNRVDNEVFKKENKHAE